MYGEYLATRALVLAVAGETDDALVSAEIAESVTKDIQARVLAAAARAVVELRQNPKQSDAAETLLQRATTHDAWDGVVCAIRGA